MVSIYPNTRLTNYGRELIARSQATGKKLQYIKLVTGDGQLDNQNIDTMTSVIAPKLECPFTSNGEFVGDGQFRIEFAVGNSSVASGFFARELGVYANLEGESDSAAKLIAYSNGGNYASYIPSKETPINSKVFSLDVVIGNSTNVTVKKIDAAYLTRGALDAHNRDTSAHQDAFNKKLDISSSQYAKSISKHNQGIQVTKGDNSQEIINFITSNYNDSDINKVLNLGTLKGLLGQGAIVASKLDGQNGYVKFANGFIIQWGVTNADPGAGGATFNFPIAFKSTNYIAIANGDQSVNNLGGIATWSNATNYLIIDNLDSRYTGKYRVIAMGCN